jgi:uncharacterized protein (TIGR02597 family)
MKTKATALMAIAVSLLAAQAVLAANVGYNVVNVPANSDVLVSVPFNGVVEQTLTVNAAPAGGNVIPLAPGSITAPNQYANTYYVRFMTGSAAGLWSTITANATDSVTITDAGIYALVGNGDEFRIYKHHTVDSVFPSALLNLSYKVGTQVLIYDNGTTGQFKAPTITTYSTFPPPGGWSAGGGSKILKPDTMFGIRNPSASPLVYLALGGVPDHPVSFLIPAGVNNDIMVGTGYPVSITVDDVNYGGVVGRQIGIYDNTASGTFKAPSLLTYATFPPPGGWSGTGGGTPITFSSGFLLRQNGGAGGVVTVSKPY